MAVRKTELESLLQRVMRAVDRWEAGWGGYEKHAATAVDAARLEEGLTEYLERLEGNYPFFHPRYAGQMLKPPHPVAVAAYVAAMRINPNNHALDGGPPTGQMEKEVVAEIARMVGFPDEALGHLTSGGTVANLEALWVARHIHPDKKIAFSADAHYTHARMCEVLRVDTVKVPTDAGGRLELSALEEVLDREDIGTVVCTLGTTGLGTVDALHEVLPLCKARGVRVHVDAAYGGFFTLLAKEGAQAPDDFPAESFRMLHRCDSVAVDPHKHGLQPYGCGCILFRDPGVGRFYKHDSPYTYFTSEDLHLGEISLECSRPGAAAGALWLTLRVLPLEPDEGLGPILAAGLRAARQWADLLERSDVLTLFTRPKTDILTFMPAVQPLALSKLNEASRQLFRAAMEDPENPLFLSLYRVSADKVAARFPDAMLDRDEAVILRSVLMKPEHEHAVERLHRRAEEVARRVLRAASGG